MSAIIIFMPEGWIVFDFVIFETWFVIEITIIDVNDAAEIRKRVEIIFNSSAYKKQVECSKKTWFDFPVDG